MPVEDPGSPSTTSELASLNWVTWFSHGGHSTLGDIPPVELEAAYDRNTDANQPVGIQ